MTPAGTQAPNPAIYSYSTGTGNTGEYRSGTSNYILFPYRPVHLLYTDYYQPPYYLEDHPQ